MSRECQRAAVLATLPHSRCLAENMHVIKDKWVSFPTRAGLVECACRGCNTVYSPTSALAQVAKSLQRAAPPCTRVSFYDQNAFNPLTKTFFSTFSGSST